MRYVRFARGFIISPRGDMGPTHYDVAARHQGDYPGLGHLISAGFVTMGQDGDVVCFGKSVSLNLEARPEDGRLLSAEFNLPVR